MKKNGSGPTRASLRDVPEVDFESYGKPRRNPFARRMKTEGWVLVHDEPSAASLREMPEADLSRTGTRRNPYAKRLQAHGYELQVGRRRPRPGEETGPTTVKSVRLPPEVWAQLEKRARAEGVALHALVRRAIVALLGPGTKETG
jgi:hypothetical protein